MSTTLNSALSLVSKTFRDVSEFHSVFLPSLAKEVGPKVCLFDAPTRKLVTTRLRPW